MIAKSFVVGIMLPHIYVAGVAGKPRHADCAGRLVAAGRNDSIEQQQAQATGAFMSPIYDTYLKDGSWF